MLAVFGRAGEEDAAECYDSSGVVHHAGPAGPQSKRIWRAACIDDRVFQEVRRRHGIGIPEDMQSVFKKMPPNVLTAVEAIVCDRRLIFPTVQRRSCPSTVFSRKHFESDSCWRLKFFPTVAQGGRVTVYCVDHATLLLSLMMLSSLFAHRPDN